MVRYRPDPLSAKDLTSVLGVLPSTSFSFSTTVPCYGGDPRSVPSLKPSPFTQDGPHPVNVWGREQCPGFLLSSWGSSEGHSGSWSSWGSGMHQRGSLTSPSAQSCFHPLFFFFLLVLIPWHSLINICKLISDLESFPGIPDLQQKAIFMKCKSDHVIFLLKGSPGWSPNLLAGFRGPLWTGVYEGLSFSAPSPIAARLVPWIPLCGSLNAPVSCWDFINYIYIYIGLNLTFLVSLANFCLLSTVMIVHLHWPSSCARNCEKCFLCITHPIPRHLWGRYRPRSSFTDEEIEAQRV